MVRIGARTELSSGTVQGEGKTLRRAQWSDEELEAESMGKCFRCPVKTKGYGSLAHPAPGL